MNELYIYDNEIPVSEDNAKDKKSKSEPVKKETPERPVREKWKSSNKKDKPVDSKKKIIVVKNGVATTKTILTGTPKKDNVKPTEQKIDRVQSTNTTLTLKEFFESAGLKTVDMRNKGGCLWVVGSKEKIGKIVDEAVENYNVSGTYTIGKAIGYVEGWYTKSKK